MTVKVKGAPTSVDMKIEQRKLSELQHYANNPRENDAQIPRMVELIKKFGFKVPILVRGNRIVDGHLRVKAATALGMEVLPVLDVGDMPEAEEKALRIVLNKSVEWAKWDEDKLGEEMKAIMAGGLDLSLTGFSETEFKKLITTKNEPPMKDPAGPLKTKQADAGQPADPEYVSLTFHMSAANRDKVMASLAKIQMEHGLTNTSQALIKLVTG